MSEQGQVIKLVGGDVIVRLKRSEACANCGACTAGLSRDEMLITAGNACGAGLNDWVRIELESAGLLTAALIMYGLPLALLLAGFLAGSYAAAALGQGYSAPIGFGVGLVLMCLAFLWIRKNENKWKAAGFKPVAADKLDDAFVS